MCTTEPMKFTIKSNGLCANERNHTIFVAWRWWINQKYHADFKNSSKNTFKTERSIEPMNYQHGPVLSLNLHVPTFSV